MCGIAGFCDYKRGLADRAPEENEALAQKWDDAQHRAGVLKLREAARVRHARSRCGIRRKAADDARGRFRFYIIQESYNR